MLRDSIGGTGLYGSVLFFCSAMPMGIPGYTLYPAVPKANEYSIWVQLSGRLELLEPLENKELERNTPVPNGL